MPTRLNCRVESRRHRAVSVEFATIAHDDCHCNGFGWKIENWTLLSRVELCRAVYSPVGSRDPVSNSSTKSVVNYSCEINTHRRRGSTRQLSRVGVVYWALVRVVKVDASARTDLHRLQGHIVKVKVKLNNNFLHSIGFMWWTTKNGHCGDVVHLIWLCGITMSVTSFLRSCLVIAMFVISESLP